MSQIPRVILLVALTLGLTACGSFGKKMKAFLGGKKAPPEKVVKRPAAKPQGYGTSYSQNKNLRLSDEQRQYKRMSADQFEDEAKIRSRQGSLWAMEGQESYLFASNMMRLKGDVLDVQIEGAPRKQLETKVQVINQLLERLKAAQSRKRLAKVQASKAAQGKSQDAARKPASSTSKTTSKKKDGEEFDVSSVPVRIEEKLGNGNYRVRGGQTFMIDKREYKVIVTGEVRGSDIDGNTVKSSQMLDSKFDIVSPRREVAM
jgi:flagellar L-ring protein precursor FlgH